MLLLWIKIIKIKHPIKIYFHICKLIKVEIPCFAPCGVIQKSSCVGLNVLVYLHTVDRRLRFYLKLEGVVFLKNSAGCFHFSRLSGIIRGWSCTQDKWQRFSALIASGSGSSLTCAKKQRATQSQSAFSVMNIWICSVRTGGGLAEHVWVQSRRECMIFILVTSEVERFSSKLPHGETLPARVDSREDWIYLFSFLWC